MRDKLDIIKSFGIEVQELESSVYKVLNPQHIVNVDKLQRALQESIEIVSSNERGEEKMENGAYTYLYNIYYILLDYDNESKLLKYIKVARQEHDCMVLSFRDNPCHVETIDTIYTADELGRVSRV